MAGALAHIVKWTDRMEVTIFVIYYVYQYISAN